METPSRVSPEQSRRGPMAVEPSIFRTGYGREEFVPTGKSEDDYIDEVVQQYCQGVPNAKENIKDFLKVARTLNATDIDAILRVARLERIIPFFAKGRARWAGGAFTPETHGIRPSTEAKIYPSLLYNVASRYCGYLATIIQEFNKVTGSRLNLPTFVKTFNAAAKDYLRTVHDFDRK